MLTVQAHRTGKVHIQKIPVWTSLYQFPSRIPRPAGKINNVHQKTLKKQKKRQTYHILNSSETLYLCFANVLAQKMNKKHTKFDRKVKNMEKKPKTILRTLQKHYTCVVLTFWHKDESAFAGPNDPPTKWTFYVAQMYKVRLCHQNPAPHVRPGRVAWGWKTPPQRSEKIRPTFQKPISTGLQTLVYTPGYTPGRSASYTIIL